MPPPLLSFHLDPLFKEQAKKTYAGILKHSSVHGVSGEARLDVARPKKRLSFNFSHQQHHEELREKPGDDSEPASGVFSSPIPTFSFKNASLLA
jgi:hypothetical protein